MSYQEITLTGTLPAPRAVEIMLDGQFGYANPLNAGTDGANTTISLFRRVTVDSQGKYKAMIIEKQEDNFAPVDSPCETVAKGPANKTRYVEVKPYTFKGEGGFCAADFEAICNAFANNTVAQKMFAPLSLENPIVAAVMAQKMQDYKSDFGQYLWFGKTGFAVNTGASAAPYYASTVTARKQAFLGGAGNGIWATIDSLVGSGVGYVDLNNGTNKGAVNPDAVGAYLRKMIDTASVELQTAIAAGKGVFIVDKAIFDALKKYLEYRGMGSDGAYESMQMQYANGVMTFEGIRVVRDMAARYFDNVTGANTTSTITSTSYGAESITHSRNLRALLCTEDSLLFVSDLTAGDSYGAAGAGMLIYEGKPGMTVPVGSINWISWMVAGVEVLDPKMFVIGYPSNNDDFV